MRMGTTVKAVRSMRSVKLRNPKHYAAPPLGKKLVVRLGLWIVLASAGTSLALAHDIVLFPEMKGTNLRVIAKFGHPGDFSPARLGSLVDLDAYSPDGKRIDCLKDMKEDGGYPSWDGRNSLQPGTWLFATRYDNGFFVKMPDGRTVNTVKLEAPDAVTAIRAFHFGKALFAISPAGPGFDRIVGHRLEIVPQENPFLVKVGGELLVKVLWEGKPLAGVGVEIGDGVTPMAEDAIPRYPTDSAGLVRVPIKGSGLRVVAVDYRVPSVAPTMATQDSYSATLVFTLKPY